MGKAAEQQHTHADVGHGVVLLGVVHQPRQHIIQPKIAQSPICAAAPGSRPSQAAQAQSRPRSRSRQPRPSACPGRGHRQRTGASARANACAPSRRDLLRPGHVPHVRGRRVDHQQPPIRVHRNVSLEPFGWEIIYLTPQASTGRVCLPNEATRHVQAFRPALHRRRSRSRLS